MLSIKTTDCKGDGATYEVRTNEDALAHVKRLLEHGTKYHGDKITVIEIRRTRPEAERRKRFTSL